MGICISRQKPISTAEESKRNGLQRSNVQNRKEKKALPKPKTPLENIETREATDAIIEDKPKTKADVTLISAALTKHFIFNDLNDEQRDLVINHMKFYILDPRKIVFEQGNQGSVFFIVSYGKLEVIDGDRRVNVLRVQDSFGELALIHDTPRTATVRTIENTGLWGLDRRTFRSTIEQINAHHYTENKRLLESIPVFKILNTSQMDSLISSISTKIFRTGQNIVNEGDSGDLLFIIKEGVVVCSQNGQEIKKLEKGQYFGEQALLYNSVRTATVTAIEDTKCLTIGRNELTSLFGTSLQLIIHKNSQRIAFDKNELLKKLTKSQFENLMNLSKIRQLNDGEKLISAGSNKKEGIIVIMKGELQNRDGITNYHVFEIIGLDEVIQQIDSAFNEDYFAKGETDVATISNSDFFTAIGGDFHKVTTNNDAIKLLKKIPLFRHLNEGQFESLIQMLTVENYASDQIIFSQNEPGDSLYLIKNGKVDVIKDGQIVRSITKDDYFGERSLLFDKFRSATVKTKGEVTCWVLYKEQFEQICDENLKKLMYKRIELQDDNIKLNDLQIVRSIGTGNFGNVFLVVHKSKKSLFALKCVDRKKIRAYEIEESLILERKVMLQVDNVLISKLIKTFKDSKRIYFLLEYIRGMTLFEVLRKLDIVGFTDAKFYTACIFTMLEHLHERGIIYRDLHPSNIMIDDEGYPKLVDFGSAKFIKERTYTIIGNPHYIAPEVISGHGYTLSADYWSAGIMLYEFLYAYVPFGEEETDPYMVYEIVKEGKLVFPSDKENKDKVKEFITQLLNKNPAVRLGGSFEILKANPWFIGINWEKILRKQLPTPFVPVTQQIIGEVEYALKNHKPMDDLITKIEKNEDIPKPRPVPNRLSENWDEEF